MPEDGGQGEEYAQQGRRHEDPPIARDVLGIALQEALADQHGERDADQQREADPAHIDQHAAARLGADRAAEDLADGDPLGIGPGIVGTHRHERQQGEELPDATKWGPEKWTEDYRDKNRINCYPTGTSPCKTACPAHIAVQGYLKKAAEGKYTEALELIKRENPFPAVCGRVCNRRCEDACTRGTIDQPIAIDAVKKFIAEQDLKAETRFVPEVNICSNVQDRWEEKIAIIGGGPAGLSCAYYLATMGYKPTVFEKNEEPGGMLRYGIPSYKLKKDVIAAEIDIMREIGVEIRTGVEVGRDVTIQGLREQGYKGLYRPVQESAPDLHPLLQQR